ncbi:MAG: hypothetical protein PHV17_02165 [Candidatus Omnitrophica bacterium]|nr:hypothetical protein [Candidatus Omnitrophota bacterium]
MIKKLVIFFPLTLILLSGCQVARNYSELKVLKELGKSQKEINAYLISQEKKFRLMKNDINRKELLIGTSKQDILKRYGDPVLAQALTGSGEETEMLLYRNPTDYFSSDKVYLYFDYQGKLLRYEYQPSMADK